MILFDKKIIFVHIPRAAGTSIKYYLKSISSKWDDSKWHLKLCEYENKYKIKLDDYFIFTCIRNPYSRIVSIYNYRKNVRGLLDTKNRKFREWFKIMINKKPSKKWIGGIPQTDYIVCNNKSICLTLLKFETIKKDFNTMLKHLNYKPKKLDHLHKLNKISTNFSKEIEKDLTYNIMEILVFY